MHNIIPLAQIKIKNGSQSKDNQTKTEAASQQPLVDICVYVRFVAQECPINASTRRRAWWVGPGFCVQILIW